MNKYHKKFLNSFTSENVIALFSRYKGSAKEITESWGMLQAAYDHFKNIDDKFICVVGDGCSPRTGALFAYWTKAEVLSIDPEFNLDHWNDHYDKQTKMGFEPQRLTLIKDRIENLEIDCLNKDSIFIWPHSHANMKNLKTINFKSISHIAMPCCDPIPKEFLQVPHISYVDYNVESEKRTIHIWKNWMVKDG